jgi:hypothetical protein
MVTGIDIFYYLEIELRSRQRSKYHEKLLKVGKEKIGSYINFKPNPKL